MIAISVYVASCSVLLNFLEPGALSKRGPLVTSSNAVGEEEDGMATRSFDLFSFVRLFIFSLSCTLTAISMVVAEVCVRFKSHHASTAIQPVSCSLLPFFTNHIPFMTLNLSIIIGIVVNMTVLVLLTPCVHECSPPGIQFSVILAVILVTNKEARKHVMLRLKQKLDSLTAH